MPAILAQNLSKAFGSRLAVNQISFQIEKGETFGILGSNGAGKSTTMRMIAARSPVTDGKLLIENLDVSLCARQIRNLIGVVPQENNLDPDLTVRENLLVYANYFRLDKHQRAATRISELLSFIRLSDRADHRIEELSGGMKRRLMIARALLHRPSILLLDEPTTGLDPNVRQEIWEKLEELRRTENLTILLSTHYMDEAEKLCQRLLVLSNGAIVAHGVPADLIVQKVGRYALEIRAAEDPAANLAANLAASAHLSNRVYSVMRGSTRIYFSESAADLTSLMTFYDSASVLLRPANLEDVFLQITGGHD